METIIQLMNDPKFLLGFSANFFYIYSVLKRRNTSNPMRPIRISWLIFFLLDLFIIGNEFLNGKMIQELGLHAGYLCGAFLVFLVSIPYGKWIDNSKVRGKIRQEHYILILSLIAAGIYLGGFGSISIIFLAIALIIGAYPTIIAIWNDPKSEDGVPWLMWLIAACLAVYDLGYISEWKFVYALIPCVYLCLNIPIAWAIGNRKTK